MSELINRWFSRAAQLNGVAACGLRYPDGTVFSRSWETTFSEPLLNELWPRLGPIAEAAGASGAERQQWVFEAGQVIATTHQSGVMFFVVLPAHVPGPDLSGVERRLAEFRALRGVANAARGSDITPSNGG